MNVLDQPDYSARILIVDDERASLSGLCNLLKQAGYINCTGLTNGAEAAEQFLHFNPDLVLLDLHMEPVSGLDVLNQVNELMTPQTRPPVVFLTADTSPQAKHDALAAGASDFLSKPLDATEVLLRISNLLTTHRLYRQCQLYSGGLARLVDKRTVELQSKTADLEKTLAELRATQQQVIQQERMRALGTMACGIAHDLNNGLSLILGYGDMLLANNEKFPPGSAVRHQLEEIVLAGSDNAKLVEHLREFYRPSAPHHNYEAVSLEAVIEDAISLTAPKWQSEAEAAGATIDIAKDLAHTAPVLGDPAELREVLTNLIFNAVDAMPVGGRLSFRTERCGDRVRLDILDTGIGMNEETLARCVDPFFTTKGEDGTGLGLAMSYGIIRRHGGTIEIASKVNQGTTFTIHLPVFDETKEPVFSRPETQAMQSLHVLVVDDHPMIRDIIGAYLAEDRHVVTTAANAREALHKFQTDRFDLVITDQAMPEMSGEELAASIKQIQPREPVILLTGFADLFNGTRKNGDTVDLVLSKPARLDDLRKAIVDVMCH
ncbi:MAG TPA: response regulator [Chthoniobacterales bacterium]|jgi:signal transduction histidine kinase|nr:response regulator [Chthoniobacterales bacterium]